MALNIEPYTTTHRLLARINSDFRRIQTYIQNLELSGGGGGGGGGGSGLTSEEVQDLIANTLVAGTNITLNYNDGAGSLTINAAGGGGGGLDQEQVEDIIGAKLAAGSGINLFYNDGTGVTTISATSTGGLTQEQVEDTIGSRVVAGTNISVTYDDTSGNTTIASTLPSWTQETLEDLIGATLIGGANTTVSYNDTTGKVTIGMSSGTPGGTGVYNDTNPTDISLPFDVIVHPVGALLRLTHGTDTNPVSVSGNIPTASISRVSNDVNPDDPSSLERVLFVAHKQKAGATGWGQALYSHAESYSTTGATDWVANTGSCGIGGNARGWAGYFWSGTNSNGTTPLHPATVTGVEIDVLASDQGIARPFSPFTPYYPGHSKGLHILGYGSTNGSGALSHSMAISILSFTTAPFECGIYVAPNTITKYWTYLFSRPEIGMFFAEGCTSTGIDFGDDSKVYSQGAVHYHSHKRLLGNSAQAHWKYDNATNAEELVTHNGTKYSFKTNSMTLPNTKGIYWGSGNPNGSITADEGSMYLNSGGGAGATLWVKESGSNTNTGWVAK